MKKIALISTVLILLVQPSAFAQSTQQRIEALTIEITFLKRLIAEQDRRISTLENKIKAGAVGSTGSTSSTGSAAPVGSVMSWKNPGNWSRIKSGMSEQQVVAILGMPTSRHGRAVVKLVYEGLISGSGYVSGNIKLMDNRVAVVNIPVF